MSLFRLSNHIFELGLDAQELSVLLTLSFLKSEHCCRKLCISLVSLFYTARCSCFSWKRSDIYGHLVKCDFDEVSCIFDR